MPPAERFKLPPRPCSVCGATVDQELRGWTTTPTGWACPARSRARGRELVEQATELIETTTPSWRLIIDPPSDPEVRGVVHELLLEDRRGLASVEKFDLQSEVLRLGSAWAARRV